MLNFRSPHSSPGSGFLVRRVSPTDQSRQVDDMPQADGAVVLQSVQKQGVEVPYHVVPDEIPDGDVEDVQVVPELLGSGYNYYNTIQKLDKLLSSRRGGEDYRNKR